jgi:hypothetical protein
MASGRASAARRSAAASQYLDGLLNDSERKSMQAMHGRLSDPGQYQVSGHCATARPQPIDSARVVSISVR